MIKLKEDTRKEIIELLRNFKKAQDPTTLVDINFDESRIEFISRGIELILKVLLEKEGL